MRLLVSTAGRRRSRRALVTAAVTVGLVVTPTAGSAGAGGVPPEVFDVSFVGNTATPIDIFLDGFDPDGEPITYAITSGPSNGVLSDDCSSGFCTYTSAAGFVGTDTFTYTASDGDLTSTPATGTIEVQEPPPPCSPAVCIDNGTVLLAINPEAHLNTGDASGSPAGPGDAGLHFIPTGNEATSPGCLCEGWGAADAGTGTTGYANVAIDGGAVNLDLVSFTSTASTAVSVVTIDDTIRVTHDFHPSAATPNLYEVTVTMTNISAGALSDMRYRRVMDWDIEPTPFAEFVTIDGGSAANLLFSSNDGFQTGNPLGPRTDLGSVGSFVDEGPNDHGALFDFGFGPLAAGESVTFNIYYGAAETEAGAVSAVAAVSAEVFSFGQPSTADGPTLGTPNTFIFAFAGVGGDPVFAPLAVDDTLTTAAGVPGSVDVLANDSDPNGDPISVTAWTNGANGTVSCTSAGVCTYTPAAGFSGSDSFTYTIEDGTGGSATATVRVTVLPPVGDNDPPVVSAGEPGSGVEGSPIGLAGSASDPDGDPLTLSWSYTAGAGVDAGATCSFSAPTAASTNITCTDDGTYTATLTADDGTNPPVSASTTVTVANAAPTVVITTPADGATHLVGATVDVAASLADMGANDTHTCSIDWGDTTVEPGTITAGVCTGSHAYTAPGTPTITVTVTDDDGDTGTDTTTLTINEPPPPATDGKVNGAGKVKDDDGKLVNVRARAKASDGTLEGHLVVHKAHCHHHHWYGWPWHDGHKGHGCVLFRATTMEGLAVDERVATWSGSGIWNGETGYTYEVRIEDTGRGRSHRWLRDTVTLVVRDSGGSVVYSIDGQLVHGNFVVR